MFLVRNYVRNVEYAKVIRQSFNNYVSNATNNQIAKPLLRKKSKSKEIGPLGWLLLVLELDNLQVIDEIVIILDFSLYQLQRSV